MWGKYLLSGAVVFFNVLPHAAALSLGSFLGTLLWIFSKRKVDRAEARCVSALGVGVTAARKTVRRSYANMGRSAVEFARLPKLRPRLTSLVSVEGRENLDEALERGKGVLIMTAHMGNWEMGGARLVMEGYAITPLYTPQRNTGGAENLIARLRADGAKMKMVPSEGFALREAFRALRRGDALTILQDLDARKEGIVVPFLGVPASNATGIVKMHRRFGSPVVPVVALRDPDGVHHRVCIQNILSDLFDEEGNPFGVNMEKSLKMCNNILSGWIEEHPEQWMWLLDKWASVVPFGK